MDSQNINYCLYTRKSSESDERQAMSIDGQLKEMYFLAKKEKLNIVSVITESHSTKQSSERPGFNKLVNQITKGEFNAILTWAPDRLSRNAGDLGRIVDLMDQQRLVQIRTYSQSFSNNPNEKSLLMILCSQAKLENNNRGVNVKRGLRSKCEAGIRPGIAPIGYINVLKANHISTIEIDKEKAPVIKEMFNKVVNQGYSGRMVKKWLDVLGFKTKAGYKLALSQVYIALQNSFYFGEFKYGNKWYKGTYEPIITKSLFDKVQIQLQVASRQWNKQTFPFKKLCVCGSCGGSVTAEIKYRRTKSNKVNTHIYYHCNRIKKYDCKEPYITEEELIKQLITYLPKLKLDTNYLLREFKVEIKRLQHLKANVINKYKPYNIQHTPDNSSKHEKNDLSKKEIVRDYILHVLTYGTPEERLKILNGIKSRFFLTQRKIDLL